ncbi:23S rRNA (guanosine(2251)-2'-O)-methyltransferase RlmB [Fusibacter tunisiensis]|uniref:23S rRNA (Guanosine2251-2'-O)-methyltransferase n=1 Tax=Fusibacter tunisiensis TaxID=1008308 RepID=A0ABS2MQY5_9FIRM|nr:23S rRNA (guanosine(2251)-2'-O)-methyltransferase RlmB [Fusibacter tunisiensis]MBM7561777.1 23S rRNA (guanosine2251-2'-O)-methyltransferase [Fusibacter tunisiensis]
MLEDIIYGRNPIFEAMESGREINKILISETSKDRTVQKIIDLAKNKNLLIQYVDKKQLDKLCEGENHQGVIAYVAPFKYYEVDEILAMASEKGETPLLVICDEITDPHNLGSIIRTANATGVHGVIIPKRRSAAVNQTVVKTSSGAAEYVPVAKVTNIVQTMERLKEAGVWIVGTDMGEQTYYEANLEGPLAVVVGNEGKGISRLVREKCDFLVSLPMLGQVSSLNASVACSIVLYEVVRQRNQRR